MSFKKTFFKNLFVSGGFAYMTQLLTLFASFITSRLLVPSDFGLVGLITVFSGFIGAFSESAISMAVIRSEYRETYYRGLNYLTMALGVVLCVITILLIYPISLFYNNSNLILPGIAIAALFIARSLSIVPNALLQKELHFGKAGKVLFFSTLFGTVSTILMAYFGAGYWSLIWSQYVTGLISFGILYKAKKNVFGKTGLVVIKVTFKKAKKLIGSIIGFNAINYWARNADNLLVGKFYGTSDLGIYNRAYLMLMMPLNLITSIFSSVMYPSLIKYKSKGGDVQEEYYFMLKVISIINIPIALVLILFPLPLVKLLWGDNWLGVATLLPYFGLLVLTQTLASTLAIIMVIFKLEKELMYSGWINAAFMVGGIALGATISLKSVAAFYSLAYITLVLPVYIFYIFNYKLKRDNINVLSFWLPKLCLSLLIWNGIYFSISQLVFLGIIVWILLILWDVKKELRMAIKTAFLKFKAG